MSAAKGDAASGGAAPRSILVLRTSALGDVVHCLPVASALRRAFPAARISWVIEEPFAPLIATHPAVDEAIPVALRRWRRTPLASTRREVVAFLRRLRAQRADVALDLMGNHKGGILARLSGAPRRIGAAQRWRREPSSATWLNDTVEPRGDHAVDRALSLLTPLGITSPAADFAADSLLPPQPSSDSAGAAVEAGSYVLLQPGAGWGNKRYPIFWWGEVARALVTAGERVRVLAGPDEAPLAAGVAEAAGDGVSPLDPGGVTGLAAWLRGARLVLGGDTGPLHLAHALGAPVLQLHGPTDPARHGPYGAPERALYRRLPCSFCYRRYAETKACLLELQPREVAARALALLAPR
ncbi:MAG TPA: glycosyltransferase family 9 protein [Thermoanaerobaculia bacterium]|nr:glycosyltransferase family 9 protein [Thermoanaerobaculia bacterium]